MREPEDDGTAGGSPTPGEGTVVEQTGLAVVHAGERIVPDARSRAVLRDLDREVGSTFEIVFPVEVEVRDAALDVDVDRVAELVLRRLALGMLGT